MAYWRRLSVISVRSSDLVVVESDVAFAITIVVSATITCDTGVCVRHSASFYIRQCLDYRNVRTGGGDIGTAA